MSALRVREKIITGRRIKKTLSFLKLCDPQPIWSSLGNHFMKAAFLDCQEASQGHYILADPRCAWFPPAFLPLVMAGLCLSGAWPALCQVSTEAENSNPSKKRLLLSSINYLKSWWFFSLTSCSFCASKFLSLTFSAVFFLLSALQSSPALCSVLSFDLLILLL